MNAIYQQEFTLSDRDTDCFGRLKLSCLLYFVQEIAGNHAAQLGTGREMLAEKNLFWVLSRHKVEINRLPLSGETVTVQTWPMPTTRVAYPRATVCCDREGNVLFRSVALWVLMDITTRAMVLPGKSGVLVQGQLMGSELDTPGSIVPKDLSNIQLKTVGFSLLDRNSHMNNTFCMDWIVDLLPSSFHREHPVRELNICYLNEAREGQKINLHWTVDSQGCLTAEAIDSLGEHRRIFAAKVHF